MALPAECWWRWWRWPAWGWGRPSPCPGSWSPRTGRSWIQRWWGLSAEGTRREDGTQSSWENARVFSTTGNVVHLLKTIFTSATLISPESSINTAHCWISYSRRSFLPEPSFGLTCTFCCKYFVEKTCVVYSDVIFLQNNKLLSKSLNN